MGHLSDQRKSIDYYVCWTKIVDFSFFLDAFWTHSNLAISKVKSLKKNIYFFGRCYEVCFPLRDFQDQVTSICWISTNFFHPKFIQNASNANINYSRKVQLFLLLIHLCVCACSTPSICVFKSILRVTCWKGEEKFLFFRSKHQKRSQDQIDFVHYP